MKLENQVASLELAKRLKELGVKQESLWYWLKAYSDDRYHVVLEGGFNKFNKDDYSAFTVAELGEMLPNTIDINETETTKWHGSTYSNLHTIALLELHKGDIEYSAIGMKRYFCSVSGDTEADARAKMLIYLIENKLIT